MSFSLASLLLPHLDLEHSFQLFPAIHEAVHVARDWKRGRQEAQAGALLHPHAVHAQRLVGRKGPPLLLEAVRDGRARFLRLGRPRHLLVQLLGGLVRVNSRCRCHLTCSQQDTSWPFPPPPQQNNYKRDRSRHCNEYYQHPHHNDSPITHKQTQRITLFLANFRAR